MDIDFKYECPYCGEAYLGEHDIYSEIYNQTKICDECRGKFKLMSIMTIEIECEVEKIRKGDKPE